MLGVGSRGGYTAEILIVLAVLGLIAAVAMNGGALRPVLASTVFKKFAPLT